MAASWAGKYSGRIVSGLSMIEFRPARASAKGYFEFNE